MKEDIVLWPWVQFFNWQHLFQETHTKWYENISLVVYSVKQDVLESIYIYIFLHFLVHIPLGNTCTKCGTDTYKHSDCTHYVQHGAFRHIQMSPSATWQQYIFFFQWIDLVIMFDRMKYSTLRNWHWQVSLLSLDSQERKCIPCVAKELRSSDAGKTAVSPRHQIVEHPLLLDTEELMPLWEYLAYI